MNYKYVQRRKRNVDHLDRAAPKRPWPTQQTRSSLNPELHAPRPSRKRAQFPDSRRTRNPRRNRTRSHRLRNTQALELPKETRILLPRQTTRRRRRPLEDIDLATPA